ncbi:molybdate ABC transporter substrate-binding protein [Spirilliplanes yamanashiensis]|uniref:Molybdate ABC transporter substrate-binding protein n=1 Tax=Spirilliplanes yamanashiensis TaxID=42233 RepID=A0A8J4DID1_9ACTN|nr:molybdate ABC transporter substrate-binding protein [Spirilliplanes yamanashiensis]MDP9817382.1 molybdate transport system substrate-binding protein [Spirilliplanes yamanashiensis]GIJ02967.1 molybdate ABC transporter substrate-binding protein [Spirilliplanes yamanashiensis]
MTLRPRPAAALPAAVLLLLAGCSGPAAAPAAPPAPPPAAPAAPSAAGHHHHAPAASAASGAPGAPGGALVVHAADQLRATLAVLLPQFEEAYPDTALAVEYGAGAEHARHILDGAPVDVFLSADAAATALVTAGHARGEPAVVARNPIVIAVPRDPAGPVGGVADLPAVRVALCADTTPCGRTARSALAAARVDVRPAAVEPGPAEALARVRTGAADAALVHRTDIVAARADVRAVDFAQANRIADEYTAVRVRTGANTAGADAFVAFLGSSLARRVLADAGLAPA